MIITLVGETDVHYNYVVEEATEMQQTGEKCMQQQQVQQHTNENTIDLSTVQ